MAMEICPKGVARLDDRDAPYRNQAVVVLTGIGRLDTRARRPSRGHVFEATKTHRRSFLGHARGAPRIAMSNGRVNADARER